MKHQTREAFAAADHQFRYEVGDYTYGLPEVLWWGEDASLYIGRYCSIARGVSILLGGNHRSDWVTTYPFSVLDAEASNLTGHPASNGDVRIGNDVWLGDSCRVMSGVTIGNGACIAASAVVTRNVPPFAIAGGVPARVIRSRFRPDQVEALQEIRWWDWDPDKIRAHYPLLLSGDVDKFIRVAKPDKYNGVKSSKYSWSHFRNKLGHKSPNNHE
jgi:acetyltransferase-like isoleucine patch superfamily enzyme